VDSLFRRNVAVLRKYQQKRRDAEQKRRDVATAQPSTAQEQGRGLRSRGKSSPQTSANNAAGSVSSSSAKLGQPIVDSEFTKRELDEILKASQNHAHMYDVAYAFPNNLREVMGQPGNGALPHNPNSTGQSVVEGVGRGSGLKKGTSNQVGHTDGLLYTADAAIPWVSMLMPISETAWLRYWPYSHYLTLRILELTKELESDLASVQNKKTKKSADDKYAEKGMDEIIRLLLIDEAQTGKIQLDALNLPCRTLTIPRGSSVIFLSSFVHSGACVPASFTTVNYRLHSYLVPAGSDFNPSHTSVTNLAYETFLHNFSGGDWNLDNSCP